MKKIISLLILLTLLTGCLGSGEPTLSVEPGYHVYGIENVSINIPNEWEVLTPAQFSSRMPGQTIIAFRSNLKNPYFTPNVTIVKGQVPANTETEDYVKSLKHRISSSLISYADLGSDNITLSVAGKPVDTTLIRSEGAEAIQSDLKHFIHVAVINGEIVYTAVGTSLATVDEGEKEKIEKIVSSLQVQ